MSKKLDTDIEPERQRLRDAIGVANVEDMEIIGYGVMYSVGYDFNCIVDRSWLLDRSEELGIPDYLLPSEPSPHYAYDRAMKWMREDWLEDYSIVAPRMDNGNPEEHRVTVDLKEGDGSRIWHVRAEVFFDEQESGQEGGTWAQHDLGFFYYDEDAQALHSVKDENLTEDNHLYAVWEDVSNAGEALFRRMLTSHVGGDIRRMMSKAVKQHSNNVIKLRRSVYLFPAGMGEFVEQMATLYREINDEFKKTGEPVAIRTFEILNTDDKQEWIQHRVEETLRGNLDQILEEGFEKFDEGEAAESVVRIIRQRMDDSTQTAETYNALLEAEIDIEKALEEQRDEIDDEDREDIIERVISQTSPEDFDE